MTADRAGRLQVLHVAQPTDGGVAAYVAAAATDQLRRGWRVMVACPPSGRLGTELDAAGVPRASWPARRAPGPTVATEVRRLAALVRSVRPDVVHLHSSKAGLVGRLVLRGGLPTIFQPHGWSWLAAGRASRPAAVAWERHSTQWTDVLLCVSRSEEQRGRGQGLTGRFAVIRNGVDLHRYRPVGAAQRAQWRTTLGLAPDAPVAVCVGRVTRQKGQDLLLRAWPATRERAPAAELALVGGGDVSALRRHSPAGVRFVPAQSEVRPWYAVADLVVLPSRWEAMPLTLLEAMACGRPVVGSDIAGIADVLPTGAGALVPPGDVAALSRAMARRLTEPALARAEGNVGPAFARSHADVSRTLCELAELTTDTLRRWR